MNQDKQFMNTKFVGHHISAGGYIFFYESSSKEIFVALIKNKKGEWWIPKGHVESWENELESCYREIEEEVNLKKEDLICVDFLEKYTFNFLDEQKRENSKEIHTYVFEAIEKLNMNVDNGGDDVKVAEWFEIKKALEVILPYSKQQLENAIKIFKQYKKI